MGMKKKDPTTDIRGLSVRNAAVTNRTCSTPTKTRYKALACAISAHVLRHVDCRTYPAAALWMLLATVTQLRRIIAPPNFSFAVVCSTCSRPGQVQAARVGHCHRHPGHNGKKWQFTSLQWWPLFAVSLNALQLCGACRVSQCLCDIVESFVLAR